METNICISKVHSFIMLSASQTKRCCHFLLNNQKTLKGTVRVGEKHSFGPGGAVFPVRFAVHALCDLGQIASC